MVHEVEFFEFTNSNFNDGSNITSSVGWSQLIIDMKLIKDILDKLLVD